MSNQVLLDDDGESIHIPYWLWGLIVFIFIAVLKFFWPNAVPFKLFEPWTWGTKSTLSGVLRAWPWYIWGVCFTGIVAFFTQNERVKNRDAEEGLVAGTLSSVKAGVLEEIAFRWMLFFGAILGTWVASGITCGFVGYVYREWMIPIADFFTLGYLKSILCNPALHWTVPAAIISANGDFRDGHKYLGLIGVINSWFGGMFLFLICFEHGLLAAILVHFIYDFLIHTVIYADCVFERANGHC